MINKKITVIVSAIAILFCGCAGCTGCSADKNDVKKEENNDVASSKSGKKENLNISILLDLSDRISPEKYPNPSMEYYTRDLGYIESIAKAFEKHLRSKPVRQDDDQIQVYFEPEPQNSKINELAKSLKLSFTKDVVTKEKIMQVSPQYVSTTKEIYAQAMNDKKYVGSDIWGFFKNKVQDYCIKPNHRNILFILTDGYVFHQDSKFTEGNKSSYLTPELVKAFKLNQSNFKQTISDGGYGFIKANDNLNDLEVVVIGVNAAKGNPFERDVIDQYWMTWLKDMKVKDPISKPISADLPSNIDPIIQKIIARDI